MPTDVLTLSSWTLHRDSTRFSSVNLSIDKQSHNRKLQFHWRKRILAKLGEGLRVWAPEASQITPPPLKNPVRIRWEYFYFVHLYLKSIFSRLIAAGRKEAVFLYHIPHFIKQIVYTSYLNIFCKPIFCEILTPIAKLFLKLTSFSVCTAFDYYSGYFQRSTGGRVLLQWLHYLWTESIINIGDVFGKKKNWLWTENFSNCLVYNSSRKQTIWSFRYIIIPSRHI